MIGIVNLIQYQNVKEVEEEPEDEEEIDFKMPDLSQGLQKLKQLGSHSESHYRPMHGIIE
jgi:hypothetical protein